MSASQRRKRSPVGFDVYYFDAYCHYHPDYPLADAEKLELIKNGWDAAVQGYRNGAPTGPSRRRRSIFRISRTPRTRICLSNQDSVPLRCICEARRTPVSSHSLRKQPAARCLLPVARLPPLGTSSGGRRAPISIDGASGWKLQRLKRAFALVAYVGPPEKP